MKTKNEASPEFIRLYGARFIQLTSLSNYLVEYDKLAWAASDTLMKYEKSGSDGRLGAEWFVYAGVGAMRPFCKEHLWNAYHIDEIMKMDNKQKLPVIYFCGGYNCLHGWDEIPKSQFKEYPRIALYK